MQSTIGYILQTIQQTLTPTTIVPKEKEQFQNRIHKLDAARTKLNIGMVASCVFGILNWPPYNLSSLCLVVAYCGYEAQTIAANIQELYLDDSKRNEAKKSNQDLFRLMTANAPLSRRLLPYMMSWIYPIESVQASIPSSAELPS